MAPSPHEWPLRELATFAKIKGGKRLPAGHRLTDEPTAHPYIRVVDCKDGGIDRSKLSYVPDATFPKIARYTIGSNDIFISIVGTVGLVARIPRELDGASLTENAAKICNIDNSVYPPYLLYFLRSEVGQAQIAALTVGSTQPKLALFRIAQIQVPCPPLPEQRAIASVLDALNDKIELNRKMSAALEAIARALFKSWFVDFDPVRAKAEGRDPGLPPEIAALFPDSLENSELGAIPKGWRAGSIDDICESIESGGTPARMIPKYWENGAIAWFKTGELNDGPLVDSSEHITDAALRNSSAKRWPAGTVLFALYASPTVGRMGLLTSPGASNQAAAGLIADTRYGTAFLFHMLLCSRQELQHIAVGAAQQNINLGVLRSHKVALPPGALARHYSTLNRPFIKRQIAIAHESRTLATVRDALLPKLISGEIRVTDAEHAVEKSI